MSFIHIKLSEAFMQYHEEFGILKETRKKVNLTSSEEIPILMITFLKDGGDDVFEVYFKNKLLAKGVLKKEDKILELNDHFESVLISKKFLKLLNRKESFLYQLIKLIKLKIKKIWIQITSSAWNKLIKDLEDVEYFKYVPTNYHSLIKERILEYKYLEVEGIQREFHADSESLAEGGVLDFLAEISSFLHKHGVYIPVKVYETDKDEDPYTGEEIEIPQFKIDDKIPDTETIKYLRPVTENFILGGDYHFTVGKYTICLYDDSIDNIWNSSANNTFYLINLLLKDVGSSERIYGLYSGNDCSAVFLTDEQYHIIKNTQLIKDSEKPWIPKKFN